MRRARRCSVWQIFRHCVLYIGADTLLFLYVSDHAMHDRVLVATEGCNAELLEDPGLIFVTLTIATTDWT